MIGIQETYDRAGRSRMLLPFLVLGVDFQLDRSLLLSPAVTDEFWTHGFGQTLAWRWRRSRYSMKQSRLTGEYSGGGTQLMAGRFPAVQDLNRIHAKINGQSVPLTHKDGMVIITLPAAGDEKSCTFEIAN